MLCDCRIRAKDPHWVSSSAWHQHQKLPGANKYVDTLKVPELDEYLTGITTGQPPAKRQRLSIPTPPQPSSSQATTSAAHISQAHGETSGNSTTAYSPIVN